MASLPRAAAAQVLAPDTLHGLADLRLGYASGEESWLDGGFGKTQVAEGAAARLAEASLEWRPRFTFALSAVVTAHLQPDLEPALDVGEAFLQWRGPPGEAGRVSLRAGLFYPPVSMEHDGVAWTTPDMLSASAINSWIGEEVKVAGVEATATGMLGAHEVSATAAVFGWNDTSGTLLSFRGWALHGIKAGLATSFPLPPLQPWMARKQAPVTDPFFELDKRAGYYGRIEWRPPAPVAFNATYYDNAGDRIAVEAKQWAWETRFLNVGVRYEPDEHTRLLAQAMNGETLMGYDTPTGHWVDMGFSAAYLLGQRDVGPHAASLRLDWFETRDRTFKAEDNNDEGGWALTAAWRHNLSPHADVIFEALHVSSDRPARRILHEAAQQDQTVVQTALRLSF